MRAYDYISPTRLKLFKTDKRKYYQQYLSDIEGPRDLQTKHMAIGSAFDAYVKSYLHESLIGKDPKFELLTLFEAQVQTQHRDKAWEAGKQLFEKYKKAGSLADLMLDLSNAVGQPMFEIEIKGVVDGYREGITKGIGGVTFLGKPDVFFINKQGAHVILDWKVNGFYANKPPNPTKGYIKLRRDGRVIGKHKDAIILDFKGMNINYGVNLEECNEEWAQQLAIYAWLCGEEIGSDFIAAIDQLVCDGREICNMSVAEHRTKLHNQFQWSVYRDAEECWQASRAEWFEFDEKKTKEENIAIATELDTYLKMIVEGDDKDKWFAEITR